MVASHRFSSSIICFGSGDVPLQTETYVTLRMLGWLPKPKVAILLSRFENGVSHTKKCRVACLWLATGVAERTILPEQFCPGTMWQSSHWTCERARSDHVEFRVWRFGVQCQLKSIQNASHRIIILCSWFVRKWSFHRTVARNLVVVRHHFRRRMVNAPQERNDLFPNSATFTSKRKPKCRVLGNPRSQLVGVHFLAMADPSQSRASNSQQSS